MICLWLGPLGLNFWTSVAPALQSWFAVKYLSCFISVMNLDLYVRCFDVEHFCMRWTDTSGLCEMRWKESGEIPTDGGHRVYFSGKEDKHEQGEGFLVHKDIVKSVIGCCPISNRLMTVWLRASPFNITIIQVYAPTSSYDDSEVDEFYRELQSQVNQTPSKTFWLYKVIGMRKLEKMHKKIGEKFVDLSATRRPMTEGSSS